MSTEPVRAGSDWLALREPADAAARAPVRVEALRTHLPAGGAEIHDLGCGSGSMARWLAARLDGPQHWVLYDRDDELLALASADPPSGAADGAAVSVETRRRDITRLDAGELAGATLITASALLDMMTADELHRLVATCAQAGCPVLITLSVIGRVDLAPPESFDRCVRDAFNAHQRRTTSGGRLLGPDAADAAVDAFTRLGHHVVVRPSPWRLGPDRSELAAEWFTGWLAAACEHRPELGEAAHAYARRRLMQASAGALSVTVHHRDLLAVPGRAAGNGLAQARLDGKTPS
jgi:SAM-dependent methyltransferase